MQSALARKFRRNASCKGGKLMTRSLVMVKSSSRSALCTELHSQEENKKIKKDQLLKRYKFANLVCLKSTALFLFNIHSLPFNRSGIYYNVCTQWLQNSQIDGRVQWRERRRCLATRSDFPSVIQQSK